MFANLREGRKKYGLKRYLQRRAKTAYNKRFHRSDFGSLVTVFGELGLRQGMTVCVHSSLSRLGYIDGGADAIIDAVQTSVGEQGHILMPAFSMGGNMAEHLKTAAPFDVQQTPSRVGVIPETFRRRPDVKRSQHPTNSVAAWGPSAGELIRDHENSLTPYGYNTPYGRLADDENAYILMLDTHLHSFLHHIQERVEFPNLFLPGRAEAQISASDGSIRTIPTRVMRPRIPYFVAVPAANGATPDWAILHDFALLFPSRRAREIEKLGYRFNGYPELLKRRESLEEAKILRSRKLGRGEIGLLRIKPYLERIEPEFSQLIDRFRDSYDVDRIAALNLPYS